MTKGRKHGSSDRHDLLLGTTYGYSNSRHATSTDQHDLDEDDVWHTQVCNKTWTDSDVNCVSPNQTVCKDRCQHDRYSSTSMLNHQYQNSDRYSKNQHGVAISAPVNIKTARPESSGSMNRPGESNRESCEWIPPHEYLAREQGKTTTTSVFEGVGRTLKGRDMSRVRDAVWSRTGFFG